MSQRSESDAIQDFDERTRAILNRDAPPVTDGRVALRLRNRDKVVEAFIELVTEGKVGTIDEIVERSGVARRSIFRHFAELSDLLLAGMTSVMARSTALAVIPDRGSGTFDHRIGAFVDARLRTLAMMHPFRSGVNSRLAGLDVVKAGVKAGTEMLLAQISAHFAEELGGLPPAEAERLVDAVHVATSYESYDVLVGQLGRSVDTVRATWTDALTRLLAV